MAYVCGDGRARRVGGAPTRPPPLSACSGSSVSTRSAGMLSIAAQSGRCSQGGSRISPRLAKRANHQLPPRGRTCARLGQAQVHGALTNRWEAALRRRLNRSGSLTVVAVPGVLFQLVCGASILGELRVISQRSAHPRAGPQASPVTPTGKAVYLAQLCCEDAEEGTSI